MTDFSNMQEIAKKQGGIQLDQLAINTKIEAQTKNTLYRITVLDNDKYKVEGGRHYSQPTETHIGGSTWGGSMIKVGWLGLGMHIEFPECTTTAVKTLKVVAPDESWEYVLV